MRAMLLAATATACAASAPDTTPDGRVDQVVLVRKYPIQPKMDVIVALRTSPTAEGASLRAAFADALRAWALTRARGELALRDLWNPIDVRATVVDAADGSIRSTADDAGLAWGEADATDAGAARFAEAVAASVRAAPSGEGTPDRLASGIDRALAIDRHARRLVVIVTTADEPAAPFERSERMRSDDVLLVETPGRRLTLETSVADGRPDCSPRPVALTLDGRAACRVRAFVPRGTVCDRARGWAPATTSTPPADPALAQMGACEVAELTGEDARACRDEREPYARASSGWCVPSRAPWCAFPLPRVVGGAAPPFAWIELVCDLDRQATGAIAARHVISGLRSRGRSTRDHTARLSTRGSFF